MSRSSRSGMALLAFLLGLGDAAVPAAADHFRGGKIEWCWSPPVPDYLYNYITFRIEAIYQRDASQQIGDTVVETFHFGDGTSQPVTLTVTEVKGDSTPGSDSWFVAAGTIPHHFYPYGTPNFVWAGLGDCCRIDGTAGPASLNNRNGAPYQVRSRVYVIEEYCSPPVPLPRVIWLSGGIGDTFEIPLPVAASAPGSGSYEVLNCRFASDGEAGGGPNPDGMTLDPATCRITWTPSGDPNKLWTTQVQTEDYISYGAFLIATTPIDFLLGLDAATPQCWLADTSPGPPTRIRVLARDLRSGLKSIDVLEAANATVQVPAIPQGTNDALEVFGTKIDQTKSSRIRLRITDLAGNATECDPVLTEEIRSTGQPVSSTYESVPPEEHVVTIYNGDPGLTSLDVEVNGKRFKMTALRSGEERTLDVASAVLSGAPSTFVLTSHGKPGGKATVMIWEGR
ncbi:MAG TPA: putative Ig domain-containing protein [Thermoanaerobaculia bacterium]